MSDKSRSPATHELTKQSLQGGQPKSHQASSKIPGMYSSRSFAWGTSLAYAEAPETLCRQPYCRGPSSPTIASVSHSERMWADTNTSTNHPYYARLTRVHHACDSNGGAGPHSMTGSRIGHILAYRNARTVVLCVHLGTACAPRYCVCTHRYCVCT